MTSSRLYGGPHDSYRDGSAVIYRLRLFGWEIASLEREDDPDPEEGMTGGSSHNFERDMNPLDPTPGEDWEWDDRKRFGFG